MATKNGSKAKATTPAAEETKPAETTTAVATTAVATTQPAGAIDEYDDGDDYSADAGKGFENQTNADRMIPMIVLLQPMSPAVTRGEAMAGQLLNSVTGAKYDAIDFVPCATDHVATRWKPRAADGTGGGFRGRLNLNDPIVTESIAAQGGRMYGKVPVIAKHVIKTQDAKGNLVDESTELVETFEIAVVVVQAYVFNAQTKTLDPVFDTSEPQFPAVLSMTSTKIKPYREWNSSISYYQRRNPKTGVKSSVPMFAHHVRMTGVKAPPRGQLVWYIPEIKPVNGDVDRSILKTTDPRYISAKTFSEQYLGGKAKADYNSVEQDAPQTGDTGGGEGASAF